MLFVLTEIGVIRIIYHKKIKKNREVWVNRLQVVINKEKTKTKTSPKKEIL